MNYRDYKNFVSGCYYHIFNRGNGKMDIFKDDQDYRNFLKRLKLALGIEDSELRRSSYGLRIKPFPKDAFSIISYSLMPNHLHFAIRQNSDIPISKLMARICASYSKYFNKKYDKVGHLMQDRFKAAVVDNDRYLLWLSAYIHLNPKVAGIGDLKNYRWSSFREYIDVEDKPFCNKEIILDRFNNIKEYVDFVKSSFGPIKDGKIIDKSDIILD